MIALLAYATIATMTLISMLTDVHWAFSSVAVLLLVVGTVWAWNEPPRPCECGKQQAGATPDDVR